MYRNKIVATIMFLLLMVSTAYASMSTKVNAVSTTPAIVTSVKAVPCSYSVITITWTKVARATGYEVYKATSSTGPYTLMLAPTKATCNSTKLETDKTYYYKVKSYRKIGRTKLYSGYSSIVNSKPYNYKPVFQNDVFVGDSITRRMGLYGYMDTAKLIAKDGATITGVKNLLVASTVKNPKRVIIMCGVNNLGLFKLNTTTFRNLYNDLIVTAKKRYPNSKIIVEPIFRVNRTASKRNSDITTCNAIIKSLAKTNRIIFLDTSSIDVSSSSARLADGLHFQPRFYPIWLAFIANRV